MPFFNTSRDAQKYERLKAGLALYRLVFGQANQEDLLENLQRQVEEITEEERDKVPPAIGKLHVEPLAD